MICFKKKWSTKKFGLLKLGSVQGKKLDGTCKFFQKKNKENVSPRYRKKKKKDMQLTLKPKLPMNWTANNKQNWGLRKGRRLKVLTFVCLGIGFKGRTVRQAIPSRTRQIKPMMRSAQRYPSAGLSKMACVTLERIKPPKPEPEMAIPTLSPRRFENHCWAALIQGNQTRDAPIPAITPCVKYKCQIYNNICFEPKSLFFHLPPSLPLLRYWQTSWRGYTKTGR